MSHEDELPQRQSGHRVISQLERIEADVSQLRRDVREDVAGMRKDLGELARAVATIVSGNFDARLEKYSDRLRMVEDRMTRSETRQIVITAVISGGVSLAITAIGLGLTVANMMIP